MLRVLFAYLMGVTIIVAAIADWDWFFEHWRAEFFVEHFGRKGARVFYGLLGAILLFLGYLLSTFPRT